MANLKTVLVCSDIKTQKTLSDFLHIFNYDVVKTTQYGIDCIEFVEENKPDIVICDAFVYDLDACRLYEELKAAGYTDNLLFVVASSVSDSSLINAILDCGVDLFTLLPTDFCSFDKKLRLALEKKRTGILDNVRIEDKEFEVKSYIRYLLDKLGFSCKVSGYEYTTEAVYMDALGKSVSNVKITKVIYPEIARKYNTTATAVERLIRIAKESAWLRGDIDLIEQLFPNMDEDGKLPTNAMFIKTLAAKVKDDLRI